jgi:hypothetical protein
MQASSSPTLRRDDQVEAPERLHAATRKRMLLSFARAAALRLSRWPIGSARWIGF